MADFPAMPLWTDAFIADTIHLTAAETGAYMMLLMCAWRRPNCDLPMDEKTLAKWARCTPAQWKRIRNNVLQFWHEEDGFFKQKKLSNVRKTVSLNVNQRKAAGKASALKRQETRATSVDNPLQQPKPKPKPVDKKEGDTNVSLVPSVPDENRSRKKYPDEFESFWKAYPKRPTDTKALAFKAWTKARKALPAEDLRMAAVNYHAFCGSTGHESLLVQTWVNREGWTADYSNHRPMNGARASPARRPSKVDDIMEARRERERRRNEGTGIQ